LTGSPWTTCRWLWCRSAVKSEHTTARATQSVHPGARYAKRAAVRAAAVFSPPSLGFPNPLLWFCPPLIFPPGPPSSLQEEEYYGDGRRKEREKALRKHRFDFMLAHKGNDNIKGLRLLSRAKSLRRSVPCLPPCFFCPCPCLCLCVWRLTKMNGRARSESEDRVQAQARAARAALDPAGAD
jgi:hypothetical protein